jgi:hypothetical protein
MHALVPRFAGTAILFLVVGVLIPTEARGQKKGKGDAAKATAADYAQLAQLNEVTGKLVSAETSSLTLRLDYPRIEANPSFNPNNANKAVLSQIKRVMADESRILKEKNPIKRQQRMAQLVRDVTRLQQQLTGVGSGATSMPYRVVKDGKDFQLNVDDKASVRWQDLPLKYDDKGNAIKYTKEQLQELKGKDKNKPGYQGKFEDLTPGQLVKLSLKASESKSGKETDGVANGPSVNMILILKDSDNPMFGQGQDPKKKKDK